jgi:hypothetical protein
VGLDLTQQETLGLLGMVMQSLGGARAQARKARSKSNLHNICIGLMMYENAHREYPANLAAVFDDGYIEDEDVLVDPADPEPEVDPQSGRRCSYRYVGKVPSDLPPGFIICYTRKGIHEGSRLVLYADCALKEVSEEDLHTPGAARGMSLGDCYKWAVDNWPGELPQDADARLRTFFEIEG